MIKLTPQATERCWHQPTDGERRTHASIDDQQINIIMLRLLAHILDEGDIVSPVRAIVLLLKVPFEPTRSESAERKVSERLKSSIPMGIGGM